MNRRRLQSVHIARCVLCDALVAAINRTQFDLPEPGHQPSEPHVCAMRPYADRTAAPYTRALQDLIDGRTGR